MTYLSPEATAVLNALFEEDNGTGQGWRNSAAAVLRSAVSSIDADDYRPLCCFEEDAWDQGVLVGVTATRGRLLSIAEELENPALEYRP